MTIQEYLQKIVCRQTEKRTKVEHFSTTIKTMTKKSRLNSSNFAQILENCRNYKILYTVSNPSKYLHLPITSLESL